MALGQSLSEKVQVGNKKGLFFPTLRWGQNKEKQAEAELCQAQEVQGGDEEEE